MASYHDEGDFAGMYVEDGLGWGGLAPTAEERRAEKAEEASLHIAQQAKHETDKPDLCEGMPHGSCKGETWCNKERACFRPA